MEQKYVQEKSARNWPSSKLKILLQAGLTILISVLVIWAAVRATGPYFPGETLAPDCAPSDPTCTVAWSQAGGGVLQGKTASSYNGNITFGADTGYKAANAICNNEFPGSHICQTDEILNTINGGAISGFTGTAWIANGPPGYMANANDCIGFTNNNPTSLGPFWEFLSTNGGRGWLTNCSVTKPIACCK